MIGVFIYADFRMAVRAFGKFHSIIAVVCCRIVGLAVISEHTVHLISAVAVDAGIACLPEVNISTDIDDFTILFECVFLPRYSLPIRLPWQAVQLRVMEGSALKNMTFDQTGTY